MYKVHSHLKVVREIVIFYVCLTVFDGHISRTNLKLSDQPYAREIPGSSSAPIAADQCYMFLIAPRF